MEILYEQAIVHMRANTGTVQLHEATSSWFLTLVLLYIHIQGVPRV